MTEPDIADAFSPDAQELVADLADLYCARDADAELAILCEQVRRDFPERVIEETVDMLIILGRHSAATALPLSRTVH